MNQNEHRSVESDRTTWPAKMFLAALVFAFITLSMFTAALDGAVINNARSQTQAGICLILGIRLLWAVYRKERSKIWVVYIACMFLAVPIWLLVEEWLRDW